MVYDNWIGLWRQMGKTFHSTSSGLSRVLEVSLRKDERIFSFSIHHWEHFDNIRLWKHQIKNIPNFHISRFAWNACWLKELSKFSWRMENLSEMNSRSVAADVLSPLFPTSQSWSSQEKKTTFKLIPSALRAQNFHEEQICLLAKSLLLCFSFTHTRNSASSTAGVLDRKTNIDFPPTRARCFHRNNIT